MRNLYITFKAFPTFEKLSTPVMYKQTAPVFNHGSQFPIMMSPEVIDKLDRFTFVLEVWDQINPGKDELVGLVKLPLSSFVYSIQTSEENHYSLNFLADQHNLYPLCIVDDALPIYSPRVG